MDINVSIISGFLGVGKTTFLKKIIPSIKGKVALIENEFGEVGIDGNLIPGELPIREINAGCICCSLALDLQNTIEELAQAYNPDEILIEPSGIASLSDIVKVCQKTSDQGRLNIGIKHQITIVDMNDISDHLEDPGVFYLDQIQNAHIILLSYFNEFNPQDVDKVIAQIRSVNQRAFILKEDWYSYDGQKLKEILDTIEDCEVESKEKLTLLPAHKMFSTFSIPHPRIFVPGEIDQTLAALKNQEYGVILRAKGILNLNTNRYIHFDFTPRHTSWTYLEEPQTPKIAVIGSNLNLEKISALF